MKQIALLTLAGFLIFQTKSGAYKIIVDNHQQAIAIKKCLLLGSKPITQNNLETCSQIILE